MDGAERVLGHRELGVDLDRLADQLDSHVIAFLAASVRRLLPPHEGLEGALRGRRARPFLRAGALAVAQGDLQRAGIGKRKAAKPLHEGPVRHRDGVERDPLAPLAPELDVARHDGQIRPRAPHLAVNRNIRSEHARRRERSLIIPGVGPWQPLEALAIDLDQRRHLHEAKGQRLGDAFPDPLLLPPEVPGGIRQDDDRSCLDRRLPPSAVRSESVSAARTANSDRRWVSCPGPPFPLPRVPLSSCPYTVPPLPRAGSRPSVPCRWAMPF